MTENNEITSLAGDPREMIDREPLRREASERSNFLSCGWLSLFLLLYVFLPAFILSAFLLLRAGSPALAYWSSLVVLSGLLWVGRNKIGNTKRFVATCLCFLLIVIFAHAVSWRFFDITHDGTVYHQPATARIAAGFNPVHDGYMYLMGPHSNWRDNWSDAATYFPKLTWYFAASVYAVLGDIQLGKAYHLILLFAALFFVLHHTREERVMKRLLWVLACLNPIVFLQLTGYLADGTLGSLSIIALFYAYLRFSGKPVPRDAHVMGIISLAMLFCIKTSGFGFASIIVLCICLQRLFAEYRASKKPWTAFAGAVKFGLRIGIPLVLLVAVLGFSPYVTNLMEGRHILYPLTRAADAQFSMDAMLNVAYPDAHNRVTRLLYSIASYPSYIILLERQDPVELKSPLWASQLEWEMYQPGAEFLTGGLGPLFFLLFLICLPFCLFLRGGENGWLILTMCVMLFIHPYACFFRYVPFLWALPFVLCLSTPRRWNYLLVVPILVGLINSGGVAYFSMKGADNFTRLLTATLSPHRGEYVLLDRSVHRLDGIFDRFGIKQRFANPEQIFFPNRHLFGFFRARLIPGRLAFGSNIAFEADIPPLPTLPVIFEEERSRPWTIMSEGIVLYDPDEVSFWIPFDYPVPRGFWNYTGRIKFYVRVTEKPVNDMEFALTASLREEEGSARPQQVAVYADNHRIGEWLWEQLGSEEKTITIPLEVLEESYHSPMNLLILRFELTDAETNIAQRFRMMFEKMEFRQND